MLARRKPAKERRRRAPSKARETGGNPKPQTLDPPPHARGHPLARRVGGGHFVPPGGNTEGPSTIPNRLCDPENDPRKGWKERDTAIGENRVNT